MKRSIVGTTLPLLLVALLAACSGEAPTAPEDEGSEPYAIDIVQGQDQYGRTGMFFPEHLVVRVFDHDGEPVPNAMVEWEVIQGPGEVSHVETEATPFGFAKVTLRAEPRLGDITVRARAASMPDVQTYFTARVSAYEVVMKSDQYNVMTFSSELRVQVGDTVEWLNKDMTDTGGTKHYMHSATSYQEPEGARTFDSPMLKFDQTFQWVPTVPGTYRYHCKDHPQAERMHGMIHVTE